MDLILWRHADAFDGMPDLSRKLTPRGHKQAADTAKWLRAHLPPNTRVIASPATRAQETASALTDDFETAVEIAPGAVPEAVLGAAGWPDAIGAVVVVGHQPTLGELAAYLLAGEAMPWSLKKSGVIWLSHRVRMDEPQVVLRAAVSPDLLKDR